MDWKTLRAGVLAGALILRFRAGRFPVGKQTAVLAGGCFWCVEAIFQRIVGVEKVVSGYANGDVASAHYEIVSTRKTGHAERCR